MDRRCQPDLILLAVTLMLLGIGTIMIYSSSVPIAEKRFGSDSFFLERHVIRALVGLVVMFILSSIDYHRWGRLSFALLLGSILLLILLFIPGFPYAATVNNVKRWLQMGPVTIQPSEVVKLTLIIYFAHTLARRQHYVHQFASGFLPPVLILVMICGLILYQPDFGMAATLVVMGLVLLYIGKASLRQLLILGSAAVPCLAFYIYTAPYRLQRVQDFLAGNKDVQGIGYQAQQALIGLGSGGLWGRGLGEGKQKLFYLPEAHTDFVFSIIGEELGFVGTFIVMVLFLLVLWRGIRIAKRAPDLFGFLLAVGISFMIFSVSLLHIAVNCVLVPTTGMPLPFISYGGSSILCTLAGIGILLNISKQAGQVMVPESTMKQRLRAICH